MIWLLTLLVSCVTVSSTETCNITVKKGKVLLPKQSLNQGAKFLSFHLNAPNKEICQQGCCETEGCDTVLYTADKVDRQGENCFLFDCHDACVFRDALEKESNYTVAVIAPLSSHFDLPDFSNLIVTSKPELSGNQPEVQITTQSHQDADKAVTQPTKDKAESEQTFPDPVKTDIQTSNNTAPPDTAVKDSTAQDIAVKDTAVTDDAAAKDIAETDDAATKDNAETEDIAVATPDSTVKETTVKDKETAVNPDIENPKNSEKEAAPAENVAEHSEPTQVASVANQPVTVKDNAEKPNKTSHKDPAPIPAKPADTDKTVKDKEESTPTEKPTVKLPNEVPVVKGNGTKPEQKEGSKGKSAGEMKMPSVVVKPEKNETKSEEVKPNVSVEVDIHTVNNEAPETYTKRDVVFWVSVVGGSTLIVLGLVAIIRYYGNKRRRLYSSLTDDYLINGMYSI